MRVFDMKRQYSWQQGYGGLEMLFVGLIIGMVIFMLFPTNFPQNILTNSSSPCSAIPTEDTFYTFEGKRYKLMRIQVPMHHVDFPPSAQAHLVNKGNVTLTNYLVTDQTFEVFLPTEPMQVSGTLTDPVTGNVIKTFSLEDYGLAVFRYIKDGSPIEVPPLFDKTDNVPNYMIDLYQEEGKLTTKPFPKELYQCSLQVDSGTAVLPTLYYPDQNWSPQKKEEQHGYFLPRYDGVRQISFGFHCKPAIYLYPKSLQHINVKVALSHGSFIYTDPIYPPETGWNVLAYPSGKLEYLGNIKSDSNGKANYPSGIFPYLYYEARIADSAIEKPTTGYITSSANLSSFLLSLLPKLGLNENETNEFKTYWEKALPKSPYYFIGVISPENLNTIEPLTITPKQDTTIRVTLYFEARDTFSVIPAPDITTPKRQGFTVVEWGGMIKQDKNHPFTCVQ